MKIEERRRIEIAKYENPDYHARREMRFWRLDRLRVWLTALPDRKTSAYLDVGCGACESMDLAKDLGFGEWEGCDVVPTRDGVIRIQGAHDLSVYFDDQFDITTCNDVLEHVLEEDVPAALSEISRVTSSAILLGISRKPDKHGYHVTIKSEEWWMGQIEENVRGAPSIIYADRIRAAKQPYMFVEIQC